MFVITDKKINGDSLLSLKEKGFEPILLPPADYLADGVSGHTDMLIFMGFGRLFCHSRYYENHTDIIDRICTATHNKLTLSNEQTGEKYPFDVLFNACIVGKSLICNKKTVSKLIIDAAIENGYEIIHVPQGYTKCSICSVSDGAIITSDKAIAQACEDKLDVLIISEGHISLPPYNFGFIGGASGALEDKIYFCGSLELHPDGEKIKEFCDMHNKTAISLSKGEIQDVGSLFFV